MLDRHRLQDQSAAAPAPVVMAQLKLHTSEQHAAIERLVPLMAADFDRARYQAHLVVMYRFHRDLEQALAAISGIHEALADFDERRKLPLLARDLRALATGLPPEGAATALPPLRSVAQGLGAMYVLEGSTLGGRVLSRHLARTLEIGPDTGGAYLASYGERLSPMWQRFGSQLEAWARGRDSAPIIAAARATFTCMTELFREAHGR